MNANQTKTDFIKFNVSPDFKVLAAKKAKENGMSISELGRMLFGAFVTGVARPAMEVSPEIIAMAKRAKMEYENGKGKTFDNADDLFEYLESTK